MAMKMLRPTEFMNQMVGVGMRPKLGRTDRSQPPMIPAMSAPPAVDSVSGTPPTLRTIEPNRAPITMNAPTNAMSVTSVARSATPSSLMALLVSCVRPTIVNRSPRLIVVVGRIGMSVAVAPRVILRRKTPRVSGICTRSTSVLPSIALLLTRTSTPSIGIASNSRSSTSSAFGPSNDTSASREPATATTSPSARTVSAVASSIFPLRRRRRTNRRVAGATDVFSRTCTPPPACAASCRCATIASASPTLNPAAAPPGRTRYARTSQRRHAVPGPPSSFTPPCFCS